jgi:N-acetylmuramoyl-L-alanine amidase
MRSMLCTAMLTCLVGLCHGCRAPQPRAEARPPAVDPMLAINTLIPAPEDFAARRVGSDDYPIPPYAKFLQGVKVCLDPGHGGDAHKRGYKRGPTGVREAEMNLRVARYLRTFLEAAGAEVKLTRDGDYDLSLEERADTANAWGADLFISLHHNAIDNKPQVNFTTVWYHNDVNYRPSDLDLARYLCYGLYDSIALPQITDVPLKSDQLMYESGFGVLRHANVTAALAESSFFTNPDEEQRLREPEYNLLEAYGLFVGLAKYAAAGLPKAYLIEPDDAIIAAQAVIPRSARDEESGSGVEQTISSEPRPVGEDAPPLPGVGDGQSETVTGSPNVLVFELDDGEGAPPLPGVGDGQSETVTGSPNVLVFELDDGLRARKAWGHERQMILTDSIAVRVDGQRAPYAFSDDGERYLLTVSLPDDLAPGEHAVDVQFQNMNKNSVLKPDFVIEVR